MKQNKINLAFFQIFVLIAGIISFSYLVGAEATPTISGGQWTSICSGIGVGIKTDGTANLETIKNLEGIKSITGLSAQLISTIDEKSVVENCAKNPDALKKLNDETFFTGANKINFIGFENKQKIFDEISNRISKPLPISNNQPLKILNLDENYNIRTEWLKKMNIETSSTNPPPQILSYNKDSKFLELGETNKWKRTIDTESLEGKNIKLTASKNGDISISDGTIITGKDAKIEYDKGLGGLKITAGADTTVDLSKRDFSKPMSKINVVSNGATVKTTDADYSGVFEGKFTGSSREFTKIGKTGMFMKEGDKQYLFSGNKMIVDNNYKLINIDGEFKDIKLGADAIKSTNAFISRGTLISSMPDAMNVKIGADGLATEANIIENGKGTIESSNGFKNLEKIDTSQATKDGLLTLENNGKTVKLENGKILKGEDFKDILANGKSLAYTYEDANGKKLTQKIENAGGTIKTSQEATPTGQSTTPEKSGLRKIWDKYKWPIIAVAAAALGAGAYMLFKKKKTQDKKKNETSNSSK